MVERTYIYKVYRDGNYLGTLPNVVSEFEYEQEINTSAARLPIEIATDIDTSGNANTEMLAEDGQTLTTEGGETILTEGLSPLVGTKDSGALIANDNDVIVTEFSSDNPNGITAFAGYISSWRTTLDSGKSTTMIDVFSYGDDIDDYIYGNITSTLQVSQASKSSDIGFWKGRDYGQTFVTDSDQTGILTIRLSLYVNSGSKTFYLFLYDSVATANAGGTPLGSSSRTISNTTPMDIDFTFSSEVAATPSTTYFFSLVADASSNSGDVTSWCVFEDYETSDIYASGNMYRNTGAGFTIVNPTYDMYFKVYSGVIETDADFVDVDPADIVRESVDAYQTYGGNATYEPANIVDVGTTVSYSFKLATIREMIQKARDLAGSDYYWFIDPATTSLIFKGASAEAQHRFIIGKHLEGLQIASTVEGITNVIYFTGGPTAGTNLLKLYTDTESLANNRRGMQRLYDNRVTSTSTAQALADAYFDEHDDEVFRGEIIILADKYDISTIDLGETVVIDGLANFMDNRHLQITRIARSPDKVVLTLGELPLRRETYINRINSELDKVTSLDNPSAPA